MKKFLKQLAWDVALLVPTSIIGAMILDIALGWEFASSSSRWNVMKRKIISIVKSVKSKIW